MRETLKRLRKAQRAALALEGERDPWLAIVIAGHEGKGLRLTAQEVSRLSLDDAIETNADAYVEELLGGPE